MHGVSPPSWPCLRVMSSLSITHKKSHNTVIKRTYPVHTRLPPLSPPSRQRKGEAGEGGGVFTSHQRTRRERGRVITRVSAPSWSCLGVEGACLSSAQRPRRTMTNTVQQLLTP